MKKTVLYIAAVLAVSGGLMWQKPMVAHAEPEVIQEAPVSTVLEVATEEDSDEDNGPAPEIQAAKKLEEELAAAEEAAAQEAAQTASARQNLVDYALQFVGGSYRAGGNDPHTGVDCSGFVRYVMQHGAGISMNRSSSSQATQGQAISSSQMQPGDLLFYSGGSGINHVAMYIGDGKIVHASTYATGIKISKWNYRNPVKIVSMF
ncbi:peptidoglycan endopeptidase [Clostridium sp. OM02-18AC]|uniref:C40 family peptidase n=1 Tax=Clostridium sp. OM02-18AC TaxID=2292311 RepID=UPI000E4F4FC5|nr:C40 family peptidase [Clostridium sp. OM02-18AC]RHV63633.1 peptidoglycan endopeptidase [Clostridium sp. OM02-18AC]